MTEGIFKIFSTSDINITDLKVKKPDAFYISIHIDKWGVSLANTSTPIWRIWRKSRDKILNSKKQPQRKKNSRNKHKIWIFI